MYQRFTAFIEKEQLLSGRERVLLAVSGGVDSVVLLDLFSRSPYEWAVAHIDHGLRGEESEADVAFVRQLAERAGKPFFLHRIEDLGSQLAKNESLQSAARRIRYAFLRETAAREGYTLIATAHQLGDQVETVLINLLRGSGTSGLRGMLPIQNGLLRPLLFAEKSEIENWALENGLKWREDSSNERDDYLRNRIRHQLLPLMKTLQPGFEKVAGQMCRRMRETEILVEEAAAGLKEKYAAAIPEGEEIETAALAAHPSALTLLHYWLRDYGFSAAQLEDALSASVSGESGAVFYSGSHRMICGRNKIRVTGQAVAAPEYILASAANTLDGISVAAAGENEFRNNRNPFTAFFDEQTLSFPLVFRPWKTGDRFMPLGMQQHKKVSDLLIDQKVPLDEKERSYVLESGGEVAWVIGHRLDDRFKVRAATARILRITVDPELLRRKSTTTTERPAS